MGFYGGNDDEHLCERIQNIHTQIHTSKFADSSNKCCRLNLIAMMKSTGEEKKKNTRWNKENVEKKRENIKHHTSLANYFLFFSSLSYFTKLNSKHSNISLATTKWNSPFLYLLLSAVNSLIISSFLSVYSCCYSMYDVLCYVNKS